MENIINQLQEFKNVSAPRTPDFNYDAGRTKHWFTRLTPRSLDADILAEVDEKFRKKWRSLLSVDDMVEEVIQALERQVGPKAV